MHNVPNVRHTLESDLAVSVKQWEHKLERSSENLFHHKINRVSGMTHDDDFVVTGTTARLIERKNKLGRSTVMVRQSASRR